MTNQIFKRGILLILLTLSAFCVLNLLCFSIPNEVFAQEIEKVHNVMLAASPEKGTVEGSGSYLVGSEARLYAVPNDGCEFICWQDQDGKELSKHNPYTFTVEVDVKVTAVFDYIKYSLGDSMSSCFTFNSLSVNSEGYGSEDLDKYPRATSIADNFYYNDIVEINFTPNSGIYLKSLSTLNFKFSDKPLKLIAVDSTDKILYEELNRETSDKNKDTKIDDYVFDEDEYDYVIVKYNEHNVVSDLIAKLKINSNIDLQFFKGDSVLKLITFSASLEGVEENVNIFNDLGLIIFKSSYYYVKITGADANKLYFLVENGAYYKIEVESNKDYKYIGLIGLEGYYDDSITGFNFEFNYQKYTINFEQIVKTSSGYVDADTEWLNLTNYDLSPNEELKITYSATNKKVVVLNSDGTTKQTDNILTNSVFGFSFYGFSATRSLTEPNSEFSFKIDSYAGTTIYVVLQYIDYNISFKAADKDGNENVSLVDRVKNLPLSAIYNRNNRILLTADLPEGFIDAGWRVKVGEGKLQEITEKTGEYLTFIPTNDITDISYYIITNYNYYSLTYSQQVFDSSGDELEMSVAKIGLFLVENFVVDVTGLKVNGKYYSDSINNESLTITATKIEDLKYSSDFGYIEIYKNGSDYSYLMFNNMKFYYNGLQFVRRVACDMKGRSAEEKEIKLDNICCDDLVFALSSVKEEGYKILYYYFDGTNIILPKGQNATVGEYLSSAYYYCSSYKENKTLKVAFTAEDNKMHLYVNTYKAYNINNFKDNIEGYSSISIESNYCKITAYADKNLVIKIPTNLINPGYEFDCWEIDLVGFEEYVTIEFKDNVYFLKIDNTNLSKFEDKNITANFKVINYTVTIKNEDADNKVIVSKDGEEVSYFVVGWDNLPTVNVASNSGYYISLAYFGNDNTKNHIVQLMGNETEQTVVEWILTEEIFEDFILKLADGNNVDLCFEQLERTYRIAIQYVVDQVDDFWASNAETIIEYNGEEGFVKTEEKATYNMVGAISGYFVVVEKIKYNTQLSLSIDVSEEEGIKFNSFSYSGEKIEGKFLVENDSFIIANFQAISYSVSFYDESTGGYLISYANNITNSSDIHIGDKLELRIYENAGFQFKKSYYIKDGTEVDLDDIKQETDYYVYTVSTFKPSIFFSTIKDELTEITIYLDFDEKEYFIKPNVINNTKNNRGTIINTTGKEANQWLDYENWQERYFKDEEFIEMDEKDGERYYKTNYVLQIKFNSSFNGIDLEYIYLGNVSYKFIGTGTKQIAGQDVTLVKENNVYTLTFKLTSELLKSSGTSKQLILGIAYKIKQYNITLNTNTINGTWLLKNYKITVSVSANKTTTSNNSKYVTLSNIYFGSSFTFSVSSSNNLNNFNAKYYLSHFYITNLEMGINYVNLNVEESKDNYSWTMSKESEDGKNTDSMGNIISVWDSISDSTNVTILAVYEPKITFSKDFHKQEDKSLIKTVVYNGYVQNLTTPDDKGTDPDIVYAEELGAAEIIYSLDGVQSVEPKNANKYKVTIKIQGIAYVGEVYLVISKASLTLSYAGAILVKEYDRTTDLTLENLNTLKSQFGLVGIKGTDTAVIDTSSISGYYETQKVQEKIKVFVSGLALGVDLLQNYILDPTLSTDILGTITKKQVTLDKSLFSFDNILYKQDIPYVLKYTINGELLFNEDLGDDSCYIDLEQIVYSLEDYSVGANKKIIVDLISAFAGEDKDNYYVVNMEYYINVHPYELSCEVEGYGTFKIIDLEEACIIPLDISSKDFHVQLISSNSESYVDLYAIVESIISRSEKLYAFFKFNIYTTKGNVINVKDLAGAYIGFNKFKDLTNVYSVGEDANKLSWTKNGVMAVIKIDENTDNIISVFVDKSYLSIWKILLIIGILLLLLIVILIVIYIYKRKASNKHQDKI